MSDVVCLFVAVVVLLKFLSHKCSDANQDAFVIQFPKHQSSLGFIYRSALLINKQKVQYSRRYSQSVSSTSQMALSMDISCFLLIC